MESKELLIIPFVLWFFLLELHPGLRNIWLRGNSSGTKSFTLINVWNLMIYPFKNLSMWSLKYWDINIYLFYLVCILFYVFCINVISLFHKRDPKWTKLYLKMQHM